MIPRSLPGAGGGTGLKPGVVATWVGLIANSVLFLLKLGVGLMASSLALVSDGVNSLTDAISSLAVMVAVHVAHREADSSHPFGHHRAEPIAGLILAIFAGIAGFEILKTAAVQLYTGEAAQIRGVWPFAVLVLSMLVKGGISWFFYRVGRSLNSPALLAGAADSQIDVLISLAALLGVAGSFAGFPYLDPLAALLISLFIFRTGYSVGRQNIDYLMGRSPDPEFLHELEEKVRAVRGVRAVDGLKAHYVGHYVHVAVEIAVDGTMSTFDTHDLEEEVKRILETVPWIDEAFVHVNPVRAEEAVGI
ncbi:MAG: cation diffusion facilitator family transporter [Acidobacteriota bacterium]